MDASSKPTVVLVHGAFAESASWNDVIARLQAEGHTCVALANPLRGVSYDSAYLVSLLDGLDGPALLVGHSYGGAVITAAASGRDDVVGLVYVAGFAQERGESCADLSEGGSLGPTLETYKLPDGATDLYIAQDKFHDQFAADLPEETTKLMGAAQRPCTEVALQAPSEADPAWKDIPSWFVFGSLDRNIPVSSHRSMAERAGSRRTEEIEGASHVVGQSHPDVVAKMVLEAAKAGAGAPAAA